MLDVPVDSWRLVFDPAILARIQELRRVDAHDPTDMVGTALLYLGKNPSSQSAADLKLAEDR